MAHGRLRDNPHAACEEHRIAKRIDDRQAPHGPSVSMERPSVHLSNRRLSTVLIALAAGGAVAPAATAATAKPAGATTILRDCGKDGVISKRYRLADLQRASRALKSKKTRKRYDAVCSGPLTSAIAALSGKPGKNSASAIVGECVRNGAITKKYKLATLKKAIKLPDDVREYTTCADLINSQINTLR